MNDYLVICYDEPHDLDERDFQAFMASAFEWAKVYRLRASTPDEAIDKIKKLHRGAIGYPHTMVIDGLSVVAEYRERTHTRHETQRMI